MRTHQPMKNMGSCSYYHCYNKKKSLLATTITDCNGEHGKMSQSSHPRFARRRPDQDTERCAGAAGEDRMKNLKCSSRQLRDEKMPSCLLALV